MDVFCEKLSSFLIKNQNISKDDRELYEYALKVLIQGFVNIVITIFIGFLFNMIKESFCFFITFFILRKFTGGLHARKYVNCLLSSLVIMLFSLFCIKYLEQNNKQILFIIVVITSIIFICFFSPLDNQNKKLSINEKKTFKYFAILFSTVFLIIVLVLIIKKSLLAYSFGMGIIIVSILLIIGKMYNLVNICR